MAIKRLAPMELTQTHSQRKYNLGSRYCSPATSTEGEKEYMYIQYDDGTANITANTHQLLVPHTGDLTKYTGDKTNLTKVTNGRFAGVLMGNCSTTSNKYAWIQIKGETWLRACGTTCAAGDALYAGPGGTDLGADIVRNTTNFTAAWTATTTLYKTIASGFGVAIAAAAETTSQLTINLNGF